MPKRVRVEQDAVFVIKPKKKVAAPRPPKVTRSSGSGTAHRLVDDSTRRKILQARLDALEASNPGDELPRTGSEQHPLADFLGLSAKARAGTFGGGVSAAGTQGHKKGGLARAGTANGTMQYTGLSLRQIVAAEAGQWPGGDDSAVDTRRVIRDDAVDAEGRPLDDGRPSQAYLAAAAAPSAVPARTLCAVCGFAARGSCPRCGARACSVVCQKHHTETRCVGGR
jgi:hypothetical protein